MVTSPIRFLPGAAAALLTTSALAQSPAAGAAEPIAIGETFTVTSAILGETRRINVYVPPAWGEAPDARRPVLYMPDGGVAEDFLHVAGLLQVSVGNGTMRPFILVGIENTERRRDLTGPTRVAKDSTIAPRVGGSAAFRRFLRSELMPVVNARYRTTGEAGIVGESLAGLFVVETFLLERDLFDHYVAFDPSLWWNDRHLLGVAAEGRGAGGGGAKTLYLASSSEPELAEVTGLLADAVRQWAEPAVTLHHHPMPAETHATIYHPAALLAFRRLFAPRPD